ncbi:MAG: adventurous gliding motility protein CglE [Deltaproteobacteria bacterium]|nr:adventurous gliding motility protein CglE [Deltaproteobacteria bacterium]
MRWYGLLALGAILSFGQSARAQGEVKGTEEVGAAEGEQTVGESRIAKIHNVERGLWFSVDYGPYYQLPIAIPQQVAFTCIGEFCLVPSLGSQIGVRVGYDVLNNLEIDGFVRGSYANFETEYARLYSGDVASFYGGVGARFSFITIDRFHATLRAGIGGAYLAPAESVQAPLPVAPTADAALGFEYFTRLRHISIGCEISSVIFIMPFSVGFSVLPTFKYTF